MIFMLDYRLQSLIEILILLFLAVWRCLVHEIDFMSFITK